MRRLPTLLTQTLLATLFLALPGVAQGNLERLNDRWDVTFEIPDRQYRTIIEFNILSDGRVDATTLGQPFIRFTEGKINDNRLQLKGNSPYGAVVINATIEGERLTGRWQVAFAGGEVRGSRDSTSLKPVSRLAIFDGVWETINKRFYDSRFNGADWQGIRTRYRPRAEAARTDGELVTLVREMLEELHSSHVNFSLLTLAQSFPQIKTDKPDAPESAAITWRKLSQSVGYIRIKQFDEGAEIVRSVDHAFDELGGSPSLIIDVRGNGGGTLSAAMRLGDYLFTKPRPVGYFATRAGLARLGAQNMEQLKPAKLPTYSGYDGHGFRRELEHQGAVMLVTGGRAKRHYRGRVVLLIDRGSGSTTEAFASVVKETRAATLIGSPTAGAMLSSVEIPIIGGWTLRLPDADFRTPGGIRVEGKGVEPDIVVQREPHNDAELTRALSFLQPKISQPDVKLLPQDYRFR